MQFSIRSIMVVITFVAILLVAWRLRPSPQILVTLSADGSATFNGEAIPEEFGSHAIKDVSPKPDNDFHARDLLHLAEQLTQFWS